MDMGNKSVRIIVEGLSKFVISLNMEIGDLHLKTDIPGEHSCNYPILNEDNFFYYYYLLSHLYRIGWSKEYLHHHRRCES